jgi:DNA-binding MarR family transcriptional regulator
MEFDPSLTLPSAPRLQSIGQTSALLFTLADRLRQQWTEHALTSGLTVSEMKVLLALRRGEETSMRSLASRLNYDASNLTTLVDHLEAENAVERKVAQVDRRVKVVTLTDNGAQIRDRFWTAVTRDAGPFAALNDDDLISLRILLERI